jgi:intergrase/recombinase
VRCVSSSREAAVDSRSKAVQAPSSVVIKALITELAELGVADHVVESISGRLSRRMLEHYSHIRIDAKRQALDALDEARLPATTMCIGVSP